MTSIEARERGSVFVDRAEAPVAPRTRRREEFELLGLLVAIMLVLLVLALTIGVGPAYLP